MDLKRAEELARQEMEKWLVPGLGLGQWTFAWNRRQKSFGVCCYDTKQIQLSRYHAEYEPEENVLDTIRHEIAHALAGSAAGHGPEWKRWARKVGATPRTRSKRPVRAPRVKYVMVCPKGVVVQKYLRKPPRKVYQNLHRYYDRRRKAETLGKLQIVPAEQWEATQ